MRQQQCTYVTSLHLQKLCLKLRPLPHPTSPTIPYVPDQSLLFFSPHFPTHSPWPLCVSRLTEVIPDVRTLMHTESVSLSNAHPHQPQINRTLLSPTTTHTYPLMCHFAALRFHGYITGWLYTLILRGGILCLCMKQAGMYRTAHSLLFSHKHAASWGRADGWAQPATCRRLPAHHRRLSGHRWQPWQPCRAKPGSTRSSPADSSPLPRHHNW